ncbi:MAG: helix-turn-helix domain-containing protein [Acidimicrobiales bacterium]
MRQRGGTTRRRDDDATSSAKEIGRQLRDAREERGLDLLAVHDRLSRPITLLESLERGNLAGLPDQAQALSTLRRYAGFLGLDGDALALQMIDAWSTMPVTPAQVGNRPDGQSAVTNVVAAVTAGPDHLRAFTQTGQVPKVRGASTAAVGGLDVGVATGPPTGTFPVVPKQDIRDSKRAVARARRRLRAPTWLKVLTWLSALLVVAVAVGFGIYQWRPQWLVSAHVLRVVEPGSGQAAPVAGGTSTTQPAQVVETSFTGQSSSYTVDTQDFTVDVATSGECWVQVTSSASSVPLVVGVQPPGKALSFPAKGTMTVQVGSAAVVVGVSIKGKNAFFNAPQSTPYTYTFTPAAS